MTGTGISLLDGGPAPETGVAHLGDALVRAAGAPDGRGVTYIRPDGTEVHQSYAELLADASRILAGLRASGAVVGEKIILQSADDTDLLGAFWACVLGGYLPLPVSADAVNGPGLLERVWSGYGRPRVLTGTGQEITPAVAADAGWSAAHLGDVATLRTAHEPDLDWHEPAAVDPVVLLLTSGSTGVPKAVTLTHRNVLTRSAATARVNKLDADTRTFNWMPLDHIGGLIMFHARDVFLGCAQVHAKIQWVLEDPLRWLDTVSTHRADTTWAPNFAFVLVNDQADRFEGRGWDLSPLRYIMNGGEAVRSGVVRRFLDLLAPYGLPATAMFPGWGMSETTAGVADCQFTEAAAGDDRYVPVGRPQPGTRIRVVDEHGDLVPWGITGRLQVTGSTITSGYYDNPVQNRQSFTEDGWFKTGDLAYVENGILTVTGRTDDVIQLGDIAYHGHEIEAAVEELDFIEPSYTVASLVTSEPGGAEELAVFFSPRTGTITADQGEQIRGRVSERLGVDVRHLLPVDRSEIPKTGIGKLRRAQLRKSFEDSLAAVPAGSAA
ncbi:AMP-binding protein [Streptomyces sp. ISL-43]|uniref:AMP-binding protein n=1 Tax=Streptomyces sp. ISL-43 TaxID=2819183 RepID=UPI001BE8D053|nr:AMP-binding protein [Streptomyces sp. ISL-43]MBT2447925.1 AMP-binding protein [Streptomyces sp. ISL-43]